MWQAKLVCPLLAPIFAVKTKEMDRNFFWMAKQDAKNQKYSLQILLTFLPGQVKGHGRRLLNRQEGPKDLPHQEAMLFRPPGKRFHILEVKVMPKPEVPSGSG